MKTKIIFALILLLISVFFASDSPLVSASNEQKRIRFEITTIGETGDERKVLARTTVEGLPGTDFNINLETGSFKMKTRFLSDLLAEDKLKIRAKLETRRFYGFSPANLPLYEEDSQNHILEIGFDESVVLLPFGRGGTEETLKIEITPTLLFVSKRDEESQKLKINFDKQIPSGEIAIEASKIPHNFEVEAVLIAEGREIARGVADCLLEEEKEISLQPTAESKFTNQIFKTKLTVDKFSRSRPKDFVGINFGFYQQTGGEVKPVISGGAGILTLGDETVYQLKEIDLPDGKDYEVRFKVRLKEKED